MTKKTNEIKYIRTDSENSDFVSLVVSLDELLKEKDGEEHAFYAQFNKTESIKNVILTYIENECIGCGALRKYDDKTAEIKRMFVKPGFRGLGIGRKILNELEAWAAELFFTECILETGKKQTEAVGLYKSYGYEVIPNYEPYAGKELSICFRKKLMINSK